MAEEQRNMRQTLAEHGFTFQKSLGQNFITDPHICPRMAEVSGAGPGVGVLEIGPGMGVLTKELAERADKVTAIELDERLLPVLAETLADYDNIRVLHGDAMKVDLKAVLEQEFAGMEVAVCANLPYYITSPVVMRLLESRLPFTSITVMVQKEAAERLCAPVGSRQSGAVTVSIAYYAAAEKCFGVPRGCFFPVPNVDSEVIRLLPHRQPPIALENEAFFFETVKGAFAQRRKTLANSLASSMGLSKEAVLSALEQAQLSPTARAETLSLSEMGALSDALFRMKKQG